MNWQKKTLIIKEPRVCMDYSKKETLIDWLTYVSYKSQREMYPNIDYYRWRKIFSDAVVYEEIFNNLKSLPTETK